MERKNDAEPPMKHESTATYEAASPSKPHPSMSRGTRFQQEGLDSKLPPPPFGNPGGSAVVCDENDNCHNIETDVGGTEPPTTTTQAEKGTKKERNLQNDATAARLPPDGGKLAFLMNGVIILPNEAVCILCLKAGPSVDGSPLLPTGCACRNPFIHVSPCLVERAWTNEENDFGKQNYMSQWKKCATCHQKYDSDYCLAEITSQRMTKVRNLPYGSKRYRDAAAQSDSFRRQIIEPSTIRKGELENIHWLDTSIPFLGADCNALPSQTSCTRLIASGKNGEIIKTREGLPFGNDLKIGGKMLSLRCDMTLESQNGVVAICLKMLSPLNRKERWKIYVTRPLYLEQKPSKQKHDDRNLYVYCTVNGFKATMFNESSPSYTNVKTSWGRIIKRHGHTAACFWKDKLTVNPGIDPCFILLLNRIFAITEITEVTNSTLKAGTSFI